MKKLKFMMAIVLIAFLTAMFLVIYIGKKLNNSIRSYSEVEAKRFGTYVINYSLNKEFIKELDNNIFEITNNEKGEIQMVDFKTKEVNKILEKATERLQKQLIDLENGKADNMDIADTFRGLRYKKIKKGIDSGGRIWYSNQALRGRRLKNSRKPCGRRDSALCRES